jgi:hypothetical protein
MAGNTTMPAERYVLEQLSLADLSFRYKRPGVERAGGWSDYSIPDPIPTPVLTGSGSEGSCFSGLRLLRATPKAGFDYSADNAASQ